MPPTVAAGTPKNRCRIIIFLIVINMGSAKEGLNKIKKVFVNKLVISSQSVSAEKIKLQNATLTLIKKCTFSFRLRN